MVAGALILASAGLGGLWVAGAVDAAGEHDALLAIGDAPGGSMPGQGEVVGVATDPTSGEVLATTATGQVWAFAPAPAGSDAPAPRLVVETGATNVVGIAAAGPDAGWLASADGAVRTFGTAPPLDQPSQVLNAPVVGIERSATGLGFWLVAADGGVFGVGDAKFYGSTGEFPINKPIVDLVASRAGYWLVAADGGVFGFGDARFHGSAASLHLNAPVVAAAAVGDGAGYWLLGADGGVFTFGDVGFVGSAVPQLDAWRAGGAVAPRAVGIAPAPSGLGYTLAVAMPLAAEPTPIDGLDPERIAQFDRLAQCESTGNWVANTGNGYYGGLQFNLGTWRREGGTSMPHLVSREEQITVADRLQAKVGWGAWPSCSRRLGYR